MALNDIALCSRALIRIGAAPITSFTDGTAESEIAGALYEPARDAMLSAYPWSFATGQTILTQLETSPIADFDNAFQLPTDYLRAISAGTGSASAASGRGVKYRITGQELHTNSSDLVLTYIYRPDEANVPPFFDQALITRLAAEFVIPITENTSRAEALFSLANKEFERARQIDAQQDTPNAIEDFNLVDVRG